LVVAVVVVTDDIPRFPLSRDLEAASPYCFTQLTFHNARRRVKGHLDQECDSPLPDRLEHSHPWGNWGVNSNYGSRRDSFQYAGWKTPSGSRWKEWNSCTEGRYRPGSALYYNDNNYTTQKANPDNTRTYATHTWRGPRGRSCDAYYGNTAYYRTQYMSLYELDAGGFPFGGDDFVTTLRFGNISIPIRCSSDWTCTGTSRWRSSRSNSNASARIRISLRTYRGWR